MTTPVKIYKPFCSWIGDFRHLFLPPETEKLKWCLVVKNYCPEWNVSSLAGRVIVAGEYTVEHYKGVVDGKQVQLLYSVILLVFTVVRVNISRH